MNTRTDDILLEIRDLQVQFYTWRGIVYALGGVDLRIGHNEIVGLIGESGSGKSVTGRSILDMLATPPGIVGGEILFEGQDILKLARVELDRVQGKEIAMISQDPLSSLNPVFTVGDQMTDAIVWSTLTGQRLGKGSIPKLIDRWTPAGRLRASVARQEAEDLLSRVGLPAPKRQLREYPHQLSGGMRQRVLIAMALVSHPKLLIADEPTTALDVTIQAQILNLIKHLSRSEGLSVLYISHDLSVVAQLCDKVAVMYAGRIVEQASALRLFRSPLHPYTQALLEAVSDRKAGAFREISGEVPDMLAPPPGCRFNPRCPVAQGDCRRLKPALEEIEPGHWVACLRVGG